LGELEDSNTFKVPAMLKRLQDGKKKTLYDLIDTNIRDAKTRQAYSV